MSQFSYIFLLLLCYVFPFFFTLIHRKMLRREGYGLVNVTTLFAGLPFVAWDIFATKRGYWEFNSDYILGKEFLGLPVEEYIFFLLIPQSSLLIWVAMKKYNAFGDFVRGFMKHFDRAKRKT